MAKQAGIIKLKGTIGGVSFYKSQDGYLAREKGGVEKERIMTDPAFQRTRENGAEFGVAGKAVKLTTSAFRPVLLNAADGRVGSRLIQRMVKVLQADTVNARGARTVAGGDPTLLKGFEFNSRSTLGGTMYVPLTKAIDRVTGEVEVSVPSFVPVNSIVAPSGTTHFKIAVMATHIDFATEEFVHDVKETALTPYNNVATAISTLTCTLNPNVTMPLFIGIAVQFFQEINTVSYPLKNGSYNAVALTDVDVVP